MAKEYAEEPIPKIRDSLDDLLQYPGVARARSKESTELPDLARKNKKAKTTGNNSNDDNDDNNDNNNNSKAPSGEQGQQMKASPRDSDQIYYTGKFVEGSATRCTVENVVFCDSQRTPKDSFEPSEPIFVLVTFKNPTIDNAFIYCGGNGIFQRSGVRLDITGEQRYPIPTSPSIRPKTCIRPGSSYTFFRQLTIGAPAKPLQPRSHKLHFETPKKNGIYDVIVKYQHPNFTFSGVFKLNISARTICTHDMESLTTRT